MLLDQKLSLILNEIKLINVNLVHAYNQIKTNQIIANDKLIKEMRQINENLVILVKYIMKYKK